MLRTLKPISHPITTLHTWLEFLIKDVWCKSDQNIDYRSLLSPELKIVCKSAKKFNSAVESIYFDFCGITDDKIKKDVLDAFYNNNKINDLCNGHTVINELNNIPLNIKTNLYDFLKIFYDTVLEYKSVPGTKVNYYKKLRKKNNINRCPVCGIEHFFSIKGKYREDFDHYFPQSEFPFSAVNCLNLVPMCKKCNQIFKRTKNPLSLNGTAYYPFEYQRPPIESKIEISNIEFNKRKDLKSKINIEFIGDKKKNDSWNALFKINKRYKNQIKKSTFSWLRDIKKDIVFHNVTDVRATLMHEISKCESDLFVDRRFLKVKLIENLLDDTNWLQLNYPDNIKIKLN